MRSGPPVTNGLSFKPSVQREPLWWIFTISKTVPDVGLVVNTAAAYAPQQWYFESLLGQFLSVQICMFDMFCMSNRTFLYSRSLTWWLLMSWNKPEAEPWSFCNRYRVEFLISHSFSLSNTRTLTHTHTHPPCGRPLQVRLHLNAKRIGAMLCYQLAHQRTQWYLLWHVKIPNIAWANRHPQSPIISQTGFVEL